MNSPARYEARVLEEITSGAGWPQLRVGVFRCHGTEPEQVGEYHRNFPTLLRTFAPFRSGDVDLALYSPDYTCTRLLALPACRDIGGEEPAAGGFCPVDYFVPSYIDYDLSVGTGTPTRHRKQVPTAEDLQPRTVQVTRPALSDGTPARVEDHHHRPLGGLRHHPFGFVAGCLWGEDSSWKVQFLDLSQAHRGILRREERFGHLALPDGVTLDRAIDMSDYEYDLKAEDSRRIAITSVQRFDLPTGKRIAPYD